MAAKYRQIAAILRSELQGADIQTEKLDTEAELCARYHASRQTVRHALQLLEEEGLIRRRQGSGSYLCREKKLVSRKVAVITSSKEHYFYPKILHDIQAVLWEQGYRTVFYEAENRVSREREILTELANSEICGLIAEGTKSALPSANADLYQALSAKGISIVFLHGRYVNLPHYPCVVDDNYRGGRMLAEYLLEQGVKHISALFKGDDMQGPLRYHGMADAMVAAGLTIPDDGIVWFDSEVLMRNEIDNLLAVFLESRLPGKGGVICHNDQIAYHLIRMLIKSGRRVPEDVRVVSFDNSYYCQMGDIGITSLGHRNHRIGESAARLLLEQIAVPGERTVTLEWVLNKRQSG